MSPSRMAIKSLEDSIKDRRARADRIEAALHGNPMLNGSKEWETVRHLRRLANQTESYLRGEVSARSRSHEPKST